MSEQLPPMDAEPEFATSIEAKVLKAKIKDVAIRFGSERKDRDGYTATFQLDSQRVLTCRHITKTGEYGKGSYVSYWQALQEYPDGSSIQLHREYQITGRNEVYYCERAIHLDDDENEVPFSAERPEGMSVLLWNRMKNKFVQKFDDNNMYSYQVTEIMDILGAVNEALVVACEDETADGF